MHHLYLLLIVAAAAGILEVEVHQRDGVLVVRDDVMDIEAGSETGIGEPREAVENGGLALEHAAEPAGAGRVPHDVVGEGRRHRLTTAAGHGVEDPSHDTGVRVLDRRIAQRIASTIRPPPRTSSPLYRTALCPGATARWGRRNSIRTRSCPRGSATHGRSPPRKRIRTSASNGPPGGGPPATHENRSATRPRRSSSSPAPTTTRLVA